MKSEVTSAPTLTPERNVVTIKMPPTGKLQIFVSLMFKHNIASPEHLNHDESRAAALWLDPNQQ